MKYYINKYILIVVGISVVVAFLTHFPELISLTDSAQQTPLFPGMRLTDVISEVGFTFISLLILFALNNLIFGFNNPSVNIPKWKMLLAFIITWACSSLLGKGFVYMHHHFDIPAINAMVHNYLHPLRDFLISCIVTGSCCLIYLNRKSQRILVENQQLRAENLLNQYEALKNQLNPHMLFNSLNTLRSLIRETPDKAQDYLQELSRVLRYTLQANESHSVSLSEEMDFVHAYIYLLKMRYEDNLLFDINISTEAGSRQLPPMSVQLLVENAVKHNEISNRKPLAIHITETGNKLTVSNRIQPKLTSTGGMRIGLDNLSKRYRLLYKQDIEIREKDNEFIVTLPLI